MGEGVFAVRPMSLDEVGIRIDYFHDSSDAHLLKLGVDRTLLPSRADWFAFYERDYSVSRPSCTYTSSITANAMQGSAHGSSGCRPRTT